MADSWFWISATDGRTVSPTFAAQADAQAFMASDWELLRDEGIESVTLRNGSEDVYGPMPLGE